MMNPADFGMIWMNQYSQVVDENASYYAQPSIDMSVMDEISHQTNSMVSGRWMSVLFGGPNVVSH